MFSFVYNCALFLLFLIALPKLLWHWLFLNKYSQSLRYRLGFAFPHFSFKQGQKVIWIHTVSMGETRAIIPLYQRLRQTYPQAAIVISTTTETGNAEAKRSMPGADAHFFLPLDFSWIMRKLIRRIQPTMLILCESDFWYHLLKIAKDQGAKVVLVNAKVSQKSAKRFQKIPFFIKRLFSQFDLLFIQSALYQKRFLDMGVPSEKTHITGNLKLDAPAKKMSDEECVAFRQKLKIEPTDPLLVIGSTHSPEEQWLLSALDLVWKEIPALKVLLVPRHPERFNEVAHLLSDRALSFNRYSDAMPKGERLTLIDTMGQLGKCYQIADLAIVAGSFASHIGGHNVFEPVVYGIPVLFGPHMHGQPDLTELVLSAQAGMQVKMEDLHKKLIDLLQNASLRREYSTSCQTLAQAMQGAAERTFAHIHKSIEL